MLQSFLQRRWLASSAGLLSLGVLLAGLAGAAPGDEPKKDEKKSETKKEEPKKEKIKKDLPAPGAPDIEDILPNLPDGVNGEEMQQQMRRLMEQMRQQFPNGRFVGGPFGGFGAGRDGRLGARVAPPSAVLADQLDLPNGQGLVVEDVVNDSAAAKAGIKNNDILLEVNSKPVPANPREFVKMLEDVKANTPVDAVVLRKGKRETIKGLSLPEAKAANEPLAPFKGVGGFGGPPAGGFPPGGFGGPPAGFNPGAAPGAPGRAGVTMSVFRTDNRFTTRHQEGTLIITVTGTIADGKAQVSSILVSDGGQDHKYESVDKVVEQYRDKVKNLVDLSERSGGKVEIKENKIK